MRSISASLAGCEAVVAGTEVRRRSASSRRMVGTFYAVYIMKRGQAGNSTVLTIRVPVALDRKLAREARRQSRLASRRASEKDVSEFIASAVDLRGWA
jgi:hypothetical protein